MRFRQGLVLLTAATLVAGACDTDGTVFSSPWSRIPDDEAVLGGAGNQMLGSVTSGGPGLVAVGWGESGGDQDAAVWTSPDGITWSRIPHDEAVLGGAGDQLMVDVTVGAPGLVAVGWDGPVGDQDAAVWTSPDGITWSQVPHNETVFGEAGFQGMFGVTVGGPGLVAVGVDDANFAPGAAVWTSPDGVTWSRVPDEAVFGGAGFQPMGSVTSGGPGLVAVGVDGSGGEEDAAVWTSPDGITWSRVPHDEAVFGGAGEQRMRSVTAGGPGLIAVGWDGLVGNQEAAMWTSPDGITWSRVPGDEAVLGGAGLQQMLGVIAGGLGLVAVGQDVQDAAVWTSPNGITWSRVPHDEAVLGGAGLQLLMVGVTVGGPGVVAIGWEGSLFGQDAAVWVAATED